jgi:hypothetical protein
VKACLAIAALCLGFQAQDTEKGPIPKEKWKADYTEKTWGLKIKAVDFPKESGQWVNGYWDCSYAAGVRYPSEECRRWLL